MAKARNMDRNIFDAAILILRERGYLSGPKDPETEEELWELWEQAESHYENLEDFYNDLATSSERRGLYFAGVTSKDSARHLMGETSLPDGAKHHWSEAYEGDRRDRRDRKMKKRQILEEARRERAPAADDFEGTKRIW